ncbi:MAG TPA: WD40 repeat domain-containing protein [Candidatus Babeliales bacterium]|nr:WD40 repeat domain-containing protein [Candidatus Babeliales bacterium]
MEREDAVARARRGGRPVEYSDADVRRLISSVPVAVSSANIRPLMAQNKREARLQTIKNKKLIASPIVLSPDAKYVFAGCSDSKIHVWDLDTRSLVRTFKGSDSGDWMQSLAISYDGRVIVSGSNQMRSTVGYCCIWDVRQGKLLHTLEHSTGGVDAVAINGNGSLVATGDGYGVICIWNSRTGELIRTWKKPGGISCLAMSVDGKLLVDGRYDYKNCAYIWDVNTGTLLKKLIGHTDAISTVSISSNNQLIATGTAAKNQGSFLWDVATGTRLRIFAQDAPGIMSVAILTDNSHMMTASQNGKVDIWDIARGALQDEVLLKINHDQLSSVATSKDGMIGAFKIENKEAIHIWYIEPSLEESLRYARRGHALDEAQRLRDKAKAMDYFPENRLQAINKGIALLKSADVSREDLEAYLGKIQNRIKKEFEEGQQENRRQMLIAPALDLGGMGGMY